MKEESRLDVFLSDDRQSITEISDPQSLSEETIDLSTLFINDVSSSGSFDLRQSQFGFFQKFLDAVPIPALLLNESYQIVFGNRACNKIAGDRARIDGSRFALLFPSSADQKQIEKVLDKVLHNRIPLIAEGVLGLDRVRMRGRIHVRPLRIKSVRTVLVVIEDLTPSSKG